MAAKPSSEPTSTEGMVFVVDGNPDVRDAVLKVAHTMNLACQGFGRGGEFLSHFQYPLKC